DVETVIEFADAKREAWIGVEKAGAYGSKQRAQDARHKSLDDACRRCRDYRSQTEHTEHEKFLRSESLCNLRQEGECQQETDTSNECANCRCCRGYGDGSGAFAFARKGISIHGHRRRT